MFEVLLLVGVFILTLLLTALLRRYALRRNLLDVPNHRSSHCLPTPRGGGLAIVSIFVLITIALALDNVIDNSAFWAILGGSLLVAAISYWDDHGHIPARWRFLAHLVAAIWVVGWLGSINSLNFGFVVLDLAWFGSVVTVLFIVWMLNLYNFMDGIDGIAGVEAISVAVGTATILWYQGNGEWALWLAVIGAAASGFLFWNWPPAKIFMGDVGSSFLGFVFAAFAVLTHNDGSLSLWVWLIICGVFVVDASLTLLVRVANGCKWYKPHRTHAYQWASRHYSSHKVVTITVLIINGFWLFPLAWYAAIRPEYAVALLVAAYLPLFAIAFRFNVGRPELAAA